VRTSTSNGNSLTQWRSGSTVAKALEAHREGLERGALLSIDEGGTRVRMLPLQGAT